MEKKTTSAKNTEMENAQSYGWSLLKSRELDMIFGWVDADFFGPDGNEHAELRKVYNRTLVEARIPGLVWEIAAV